MSDPGADLPTEDFVDLYDNAPCFYLSVGTDNRVVKANRTFLVHLGLEGDALVGKPFLDLLSFGSKIAFETHLSPLLRLQGTVDDVALDLVDGEGNKIPVLGNAAVRRDEEGNHLFTRFTLMAAGDRRAFEQGLIHARDEAQGHIDQHREAARERERFIAILGHDLRNPLAAVKSGIELLRKKNDPKRRDEIHARLSSPLERAEELVETVLDLAHSRFSDGIEISCAKAQPMRPMIERIMSEAQAVHPDREYRLEVDGLTPVDCDPHRIAQLLANLLSNAAHHGADDGPIRVRAWCEEGCFYLQVSNSGDPIPEEQRARLFEPFVGKRSERNKSGLGLGLFIVNEIARAHHGKMDVASDREETKFTLAMPVTAPLQDDPTN